MSRSRVAGRGPQPLLHVDQFLGHVPPPSVQLDNATIVWLDKEIHFGAADPSKLRLDRNHQPEPQPPLAVMGTNRKSIDPTSTAVVRPHDGSDHDAVCLSDEEQLRI